MDENGKYHECDYCDFDEGWHDCPCCGVKHRPPTEEEVAAHYKEEGSDGAD